MGNLIVSQGTLYGVDNDVELFEGVRYVDVYEVSEDVYNDLAVERVVEL